MPLTYLVIDVQQVFWLMAFASLGGTLVPIALVTLTNNTFESFLRVDDAVRFAILDWDRAIIWAVLEQ